MKTSNIRRLAAAATLTVALFGSSPPLAAASHELVIPEGTEVKLALSQTLSSATAAVNEPVLFEVAEAVTIDGVTVIEEGARARGTITHAQHRKGFGRRGKLAFTIEVVETTSGQNVILSASRAFKGKDLYGTAGVVTILTGPFGVFVKGKDVEVPAGAEYSVYVAGERRVRHPGHS